METLSFYDQGSTGQSHEILAHTVKPSTLNPTAQEFVPQIPEQAIA